MLAHFRSRSIARCSATRVEQPLPVKRPSPISVLRRFLSPKSENTEPVYIHSPNTIRSLYLSIRPQKHLLTPAHLSALVSLFGSLSVGNPHHLLHSIRNDDNQRYLGFLAKLVGDKLSLKHPLCSSDRYWMMRLLFSRLDKGTLAKGICILSLTHRRKRVTRIQGVVQKSSLRVRTIGYSCCLRASSRSIPPTSMRVGGGSL